MVIIFLLFCVNIGIAVWYFGFQEKLGTAILLCLHLYLLSGTLRWLISDIIWAKVFGNRLGVRKNVAGAGLIFSLATPIVFGVLFWLYVTLKN